MSTSHVTSKELPALNTIFRLTSISHTRRKHLFRKGPHPHPTFVALGLGQAEQGAISVDMAKSLAAQAQSWPRTRYGPREPATMPQQWWTAGNRRLGTHPKEKHRKQPAARKRAPSPGGSFGFSSRGLLAGSASCTRAQLPTWGPFSK